MRTILVIAPLVLALAAGCADAPITAADLQADGQLRAQTNSQQSVLAASETNQPKAQVAEHLQVMGMLASQAEGALEDATRFSLEAEAVYLHLRADDLAQPRPVTFVWQHGDQRRETMGFLQPSETISLAASLPLAQFVEEGMNPDPEAQLEPDPLAQAGAWQVEVYSTDANGRSLVFERDFEVLPVEEYEALLAPPS